MEIIGWLQGILASVLEGAMISGQAYTVAAIILLAPLALFGLSYTSLLGKKIKTLHVAWKVVVVMTFFMFLSSIGSYSLSRKKDFELEQTSLEIIRLREEARKTPPVNSTPIPQPQLRFSIPTKRYLDGFVDHGGKARIKLFMLKVTHDIPMQIVKGVQVRITGIENRGSIDLPFLGKQGSNITTYTELEFTRDVYADGEYVFVASEYTRWPSGEVNGLFYGADKVVDISKVAGAIYLLTITARGDGARPGQIKLELKLDSKARISIEEVQD